MKDCTVCAGSLREKTASCGGLLGDREAKRVSEETHLARRERVMIQSYVLWLFLLCTAYLSYLTPTSRAAAPAPPCTILLHSRGAAVTPEKSKNSETGGGFIQVTQVEPNAVMILMRGAVAARADHKDGSAAMQFELNQDFEIVPAPLRKGVVIRPPRIILSAWVIGALSTSPVPEGGTAQQAPGCAEIVAGETPLLKICVKPHAVSGGQNLLVNDRFGPVEAPAAPCTGYTLHQTFALSASQAKTACHPGFAVADFDPDPRLDALWNPVLKPFRAVPHKDFGFRVLLRVAEVALPSPAALNAPAEQMLPPPKPEKSKAASGEEGPAKP
jgi:hypothetical protein